MYDIKEKVISIIIWVLTALIIAGLISLFVLHFNYDANTKLMFNKWIFENQEVWEKMIVINPNWKPEFIVQREINLDKIFLGGIFPALILSLGGISASIVYPLCEWY